MTDPLRAALTDDELAAIRERYSRRTPEGRRPQQWARLSDVDALLAHIDALASVPDEGQEPAECAICGHYVAGGQPVHNICVAELTAKAEDARPAAAPALRAALREPIARWIGKSGFVRPVNGDNDRAWRHMLTEADGLLDEPDVRAALASAPDEGRDPAADMDDYDPRAHAGHEAFMRHGLCSHPSHAARPAAAPALDEPTGRAMPDDEAIGA